MRRPPLLLLLAASCAVPWDTAGLPVEPGGDAQRVLDQAHGFLLIAPKGWVRDDEMAKARGEALAMRDQAPPRSIAKRLHLQLTPLPEFIDFAEYERDVAAELARDGSEFRVGKREWTTIDGRPALYIEGRLIDAQEPFHVLACEILAGASGYRLWCRCHEAAYAQAGAALAATIASLHLLGTDPPAGRMLYDRDGVLRAGDGGFRMRLGPGWLRDPSRDPRRLRLRHETAPGKVDVMLELVMHPRRLDLDIDQFIAGLAKALLVNGTRLLVVEKKPRQLAGTDSPWLHGQEVEGDMRSEMQGALVHGNDRSFVVVMTAAPRDYERCRPLFDQILQSIETR